MIVARRLLFIHGAGGDLDDRPLAEEFAETLGMTLDYPVIPPDDMSRAAVIRPAVASLSASDVVIAHSFGASMLMQVLSDDPGIAVRAAVLLAMPDWSPAGWTSPNTTSAIGSRQSRSHCTIVGTMRLCRLGT